MKTVLISIHPEHVYNILIGKKTKEIRTVAPKCKLPFRAVVCVTKGNYLVRQPDKTFRIYSKRDYRGLEREPDFMGFKMNGKVVCEFICNKIDQITPMNFDKYLESACINFLDLDVYTKGKCFAKAMNITQLIIYDKAKDLSEYWTPCKDYRCGYNNNFTYVCPIFEQGNCHSNMCGGCNPIIRLPQSWQYVEPLN